MKKSNNLENNTATLIENDEPMELVKHLSHQKMDYMNDAESVLQGNTIPVIDEEHLKFILDYVKGARGFDYDSDAVIKGSKRFVKNPHYVHINLSQIADMTMIAMTMHEVDDDAENGMSDSIEPYDLLSEYGVFGYVYNIDVPDFSELGYSFYELEGNKVKRIG
jgi:hypothetical protein